MLESCHQRRQYRGALHPFAVPGAGFHTKGLGSFDAYTGSTLLERYRIEIPVTRRQDQLFVRLSVQGYNTTDDIDALVEAIREIYAF